MRLAGSAKGIADLRRDRARLRTRSRAGSPWSLWRSARRPFVVGHHGDVDADIADVVQYRDPRPSPVVDLVAHGTAGHREGDRDVDRAPLDRHVGTMSRSTMLRWSRGS